MSPTPTPTAFRALICRCFHQVRSGICRRQLEDPAAVHRHPSNPCCPAKIRRRISFADLRRPPRPIIPSQPRKRRNGTFAGTHFAHKRCWARAGIQQIHSGKLYIERHEMCGICGEIVFDDSSAGRCIAAMLDTLQPRGPDAAGSFSQGCVAFGHRRLSIIDLSPTSQQPMLDPELGLAIVFNGCIYNYRELRRELSAKGYRFFSQGDTEVILKAHAEWAPRCVERFYGMFSFAIWERSSGRIVLARDRLGIKPLYICETPGRFRFASTLPALLAAGDVDTSIDPAALHHYMSLHAVVPAPMTIIKGVKKLPAATICTIEPDGRRREETYWQLEVGPRSQDRSMTEADWQDAVRVTFGKAGARGGGA